MLCMICDDQKSELEKIEQIVTEYAGAHSELSLEIKCFNKPFDMLDEIEKNGAPDIALLDVCMPGVLGTEIAREIQSKSEDSADVILLTTSPDFAVEAFALHVSDYLTKPYTKEKLKKSLDRVIEKRQKRLFVPIQCGNEIHRIDLLSVLYAESKNHSIEIHFMSGHCLKARLALTEMKEYMQGISGFSMVGASYLVNLRCVQCVLSTTLQMANGDVIPVPRRLRGELKKQYFDFYTKEVTEK